LKTIFSYSVIFAMLVLFALFLDATSGVFIIIIFAGAIVLSTALHFYAVKKFDCDVSVNAELVEKGEEIALTVTIAKAAFFLPTVFEIKLMPSYHFDCDSDSCSVTLGRSEKTRAFTLKSAFWGKGTIGIEYVKCHDILGIFSAFKNISGFSGIIDKNTRHVKVFPSVPDLSERSDLVRVLEDASAYDDNEQSREIPSAIIGFPGYEHRNYVPGDPLKSVNWKLSAKRDRLLVRKPEAYAGGDQVFVLDSRASDKSDVREARTVEQTALEAMLALTRVMTKQEIACRVYVKADGAWGFFTVTGEDELERLRFSLTEYAFDSGGYLPDLTAEKGGGLVVFAAKADLALTETYRQKGLMPEVASPEPGADWLIRQSHGEIIFVR